MEDAAGAAGSSSSLPAAITMPSSQRGQKRAAPDEDEAAGDGAARGSPRRAGVDTVAEEEDESTDCVDSEEEEDELDEADDVAPPERQLLEFLRVRPGTAADAGGAAAGASAADREPVDVTLRLGVGPVAGGYRGGTVDTTLSLRLRSAAAAPGEDEGRRFQSHGKPATGAALGAASNAEPDFDEGLASDAMVAALLHGREEGFASFLDPADGFAMACFAVTAGDGRVGPAADDDAAGRPSSGLDLNKPCPSELPDGAPDPSDVPVPDPVAVDDDDLEAHVDELGVATAMVEQRRQSSTPFIDFCSSAHDVRAPGILTAESS